MYQVWKKLHNEKQYEKTLWERMRDRTSFSLLGVWISNFLEKKFPESPHQNAQRRSISTGNLWSRYNFFLLAPMIPCCKMQCRTLLAMLAIAAFCTVYKDSFFFVGSKVRPNSKQTSDFNQYLMMGDPPLFPCTLCTYQAIQNWNLRRHLITAVA